MIELAILNALPLILLSRADAVPVAQSLGRRWLIPEAVRSEMERKGPGEVAVRTLRETLWFAVATIGDVPPEIAAGELGAGEFAVLSLARRESNSVAVVDDLIDVGMNPTPATRAEILCRARKVP